MKTHHIILIALITCGTLAAQGTWTPLEHDGKTSIAYNWKGPVQNQTTPSIEGLAAVLATLDKSVPLKEISFEDYYFNNPTVQDEVKKELRSRSLEPIAPPGITLGGGSMPDPVQIKKQTEKILTEPLLKTATIAKLNELLGIYGYSIERIDFKYTCSMNDKKRLILTPKLLLIITPKVNKDAEQTGRGDGEKPSN